MASAYSAPQDFGKYIQPINTELVNFVLQSKQQQYNYNVAKVEETLQQFGNLGLVRGQDKQYLADRINGAIDGLGEIGSADWSDPNVERQITSGIRGAIDSRVRNDIAMSKKFTNFQQQVQTLKEKNPEQYADSNLNFALAKSGAMAWLNGQTNSYGNLEYTPFVDVAAKQREILDNSITMKHGITREVVDPTDGTRYIETEHYGLTEHEVREKVMSNLTPQEQKQLEINAWSSVGDAAPQVYDAYVAPRVKELGEKRATLKLNFEGKTAAEKAIINQEVRDIDAQLAGIEAVKKNSSQLHTFLGAEDLVRGLAATYAPVETSFKYNDNPAARKALENSTKNAQIAVGVTDMNQNGNIDVTSTPILTSTEEQGVDFAAKAEQELSNYERDIKGTFNTAYNRLSPQNKTAFDIGYQQYIKEQGLQDNATNKNAFMLEHSNGGMGSYYTPQEVVAAKRLDRDYKRKLQVKTDNFNEAMEEANAVAFQRVFSTLKDRGENSQIQMVDENGQVVSMGDYLEGYDSVESLPKEKRDVLLNSVYADMTLSQTKNHDTSGDVNNLNNFNISRLAQVNGETDKELPMLVNPEDIIFSGYSKGKDFVKLKKDMQLPAQMTQEQFDAHIKPLMNDWRFAMDNPSASGATQWAMETARKIPFIGSVVDAVAGTSERVYANMGRDLGDRRVRDNIIIGGEGTRTRAAIETALAKGTYDKLSLRDDSVEDDSTLRQALTNQADFQESYKAKMGEDAGNYAQNNVITVEASGSRKGEDIPAFEELKQKSGGQLVDKYPINVIENDLGDSYIAYQQATVTTYVDGEPSTKTIRREAIIPKSTLAGGEFDKWINQQSDRDRLNTQNTKEVTSSKIAFADANSHRAYVTGVGKMLGATSDKEMAKFTAQGAKASILEAHPTIFNHPQAGGVYKNLANQMIDNSHLFRLNVIANEWDRYDMAIQYQAKEDGQMVWKNLKVLPTGTDDITDTVAMIDTAPQIFLYDYMDRLFTEIETKGAESVAGDLTTLSKIFPQ